MLSISVTLALSDFTFNNLPPANNGVELEFQGNAAGGSGFNETMTTTFFYAYHAESGGSGTLMYNTGADQAQGTGFQLLAGACGNDNDQCINGTLHLFDPSNTTFVKHFISRIQVYRSTGSSAEASSVEAFTAGYFNTTSAIDEIQFKMSSGNIDSGTIKMYGVK